MRPMGIVLPLNLWQDRETGKCYALHRECSDKLFELVRDAGGNPLGRFAPMGPTDGECNYGACDVAE